MKPQPAGAKMHRPGASFATLALFLACSSSPPGAGKDTSLETGVELTCETCPASSASATQSLSLDDLSTQSERTRNNPLKGFMTSYLWGEPVSDFADQMEFLYLPMSELWNEDGETLDAGLEPYLVAAETRGHHAVLRVYIDYPSKDLGLPDYLMSTVPCSPYTEHGGGCSPDYDHPDLLSAMLGLISAMGERYDGDIRLGFLQVGLLGFWGEWHTYPHTDWFPSEETQAAVLNAYDSAFLQTQMQVRRAAANSVELRIGFHDDSFAYSTIGAEGWFFVPGLESAGASERWKEVSIGGELRPELQSFVFEEDYQTGPFAQDMEECINATHASYLLNYHAFNGGEQGYLGSARTRAENAAIHLGYQFEIQAAAASVSGLQEDTVEVEISIDLSQTGVAPFYYPLFLELKSDALTSAVQDDEDLRTLLPGQSRTLTVELGRVPVDLLSTPLKIGLVSPMLQSSQQLLLATESPWTEEGGQTALQWEFGCTAEEASASLGEVIGVTEEGCDCRCDVDGQYRACEETLCGPSAETN
jgi:hypothetical protein